MKKLKGLIVAPFTGFTEDGEVDIQAVARQQKYYKENGIIGAYVCGTTGEGSALTMEEKKALFQEWARYRDEHFTVIGFVGGTSVKDAQELTAWAATCGLDAVAMTAPYYQRAANVHELALTLAEVASAAPELPFFYYHIPILTHVCFPMIELLREVDGLIPNFAGIKYTFEDLMDYLFCLEFGNRKYDILYGRDEMMLPALSLGGQAFVGSTYGYSAPIYLDLMKAFEEGDIKRAAALQYQTDRLIAVLGKYGNGTGKAFMKAAGLDLGPCRHPLTTLTESQYASFLEDLRALDFGKYQCKP